MPPGNCIDGTIILANLMIFVTPGTEAAIRADPNLSDAAILMLDQ